MKKLILLFAAATVLLAFNSCKDYDRFDDGGDPSVKSETNYLVMFYGLGGGNLDTCIVSNIVQAIDEGGSDKVAMTFEYKLSKSIMKNQELDNFDGTRRFTLDDNAHLKGKFKSLSKDYPFLDEPSFNYYLKNIKSERIGNAYYDMNCSDSLAAFIRWSKMKYPNAKRTLLVLSDHGSGWGLSDGQAQTQTQSRAILFDDHLDMKNLKAQDVVDGITKGGGIDICYTDACLMSMYENIYTYAKAMKYLLTAVEVTPDEGGDYRKLINILKTTGTTDAELEDAMHTYSEHCVSKEWWGMTEVGYVNYSDLGLYNLSKLYTITPLLQKIAHTMAEKFVSTESIEATAEELPLSDNFAPYMRKAVTQCLVSYRVDEFNIKSLPKNLVPYLRKDLSVIKHKNSDEEYFDAEKLIDWVKYAPTDNAKAAYEAYPDDWNNLRKAIIGNTYISYPLTDLLHQIDLELSAVGARNNPFAKLHNNLISAIKSIANISCTTPVNLPDIDQAYEYCSPGIFIIPFNDTYMSDYNPYYASIPDYEVALRYYKASDFDQVVGWNNFLKVIDVIPSILHNPGRNNKK